MEPDRETFAMQMRVIERTRMPFGRYGPDHFPPRGVPIYDLPLEYLVWMERRGWPKSPLGELLQVIYEIKAAGAGEVFEPMRRRNGGRTDLRKDRSAGEYQFGEED